MSWLQPYLVFSSEVARVNELYWSSNYAYSRTLHVLDFLKSTGNHLPDPEVRSIWGAKEYSLDRVSKAPLSAFRHMLSDGNPEALRTTSILHLCSAFENALSGYFFLCCLYDGQKYEASYIGDNIPNLLKGSSFESRKKSILSLLDSKTSPLCGAYTQRLKLFSSTWGFTAIANASVTRLNVYYRTRNQIAHDQGLGAPDRPDFSAVEILRNKVSLDETKWKQMIHDFQIVLESLDARISEYVVKDKGLSLAVYRTLVRDGAMTTTELMDTLTKEWRLGTNRKDKIHKVVQDVGGTVKQLRANIYEVSI